MRRETPSGWKAGWLVFALPLAGAGTRGACWESGGRRWGGRVSAVEVSRAEGGELGRFL